MPSALQPWVENLSMMQQCVLLSSIRAPDGVAKGHPSKLLYRWFRRCVIICSFENKVHSTPDEPCGGSFTAPIHDIISSVELYFYNVDSVPHHAHMHLVHAAEILAYKHPSFDTRRFWFDFYKDAVNDLHLFEESEEQMDYRLSGDESRWRETEHYPAKQ